MTEFAKIFTLNEDNVTQVATHMATDNPDKSYVVICPTESMYYFACNPRNHISYTNFKKMTDRNKRYELFLYNFELGKIFMNINTVEHDIIKVITNKYWSSTSQNSVSIVCKPSVYVNPEVCFDNEKWMTFSYTNTKCIKRFQELCMMPIIAQSVYVNQIPCTHTGHIIPTYHDKDILVFEQEEPCKNCCFSTELVITDNIIWVNNLGFVSPTEIYNLLKENGINNFEIKIKNNAPVYKIPIHKNIKAFNWINVEIIPPTDILKEIRQKTLNYFGNSIFIDFNRKNVNIYKECAGYVDLSAGGDYKEAIINFYNILHTCITHNIKNVLIYDFYSHHNHNENHIITVILNMIKKYVGDDFMAIPIQYVTDEIKEYFDSRTEDCMECVD
jgi:hypothetical protein